MFQLGMMEVKGEGGASKFSIGIRRIKEASELGHEEASETVKKITDVL